MVLALVGLGAIAPTGQRIPDLMRAHPRVVRTLAEDRPGCSRLRRLVGRRISSPLGSADGAEYRRYALTMSAKRPTPTWRDYTWLLAAAAAMVWSTWNVIQVSISWASGAMEWWAALFLVAFWMAIGFLVGVGSWRRLTPRGNGRPTCPRHGVVEDGVP